MAINFQINGKAASREEFSNHCQNFYQYLFHSVENYISLKKENTIFEIGKDKLIINVTKK